MSEEIKNEQVQQQPQQPQGWRDVQVSVELPLSALVQFMNIMNQRIASLEDLVTVQGADGKAISLTEAYRLQTEAEMEALRKQQQEEEETKESQGE